MTSRILFVDDEDSIHFGVREYFAVIGYPVDCARTAKEAFERIARTRYAVVIADLRLSADFHGEPEGLALIERVRREHPDTRVIVLTACGGELEDEARRRGADCFLQKPQSLRRVADVLDEMCGGA